MKKFLLPLLVLALTITAARADVIVWRGNGTFLNGNNATAQAFPRILYFVSDQATLQSSLVIATPRLRIVQAVGPFSLGYAEIATRPLRVIYLSSGGGFFTNVNNFRNFFLSLGGQKASLALRSGGANVVQLPRVLGGSYNDLSSNGNGQVAAGSMLLRFDSPRTLTFNGQGLTAGQVTSNLVGAFTAAGYTVVQ